MSDRDPITLAANGLGAQVYVARDLLRDSRCQLDTGDQARPEILPDGGIAFRPLDRDRGGSTRE